MKERPLLEGTNRAQACDFAILRSFIGIWSRRGESQNRKPDPDLNLISGAAVVAKPKASLRALGSCIEGVRPAICAILIA